MLSISLKQIRAKRGHLGCNNSFKKTISACWLELKIKGHPDNCSCFRGNWQKLFESNLKEVLKFKSYNHSFRKIIDVKEGLYAKTYPNSIIYSQKNCQINSVSLNNAK